MFPALQVRNCSKISTLMHSAIRIPYQEQVRRMTIIHYWIIIIALPLINNSYELIIDAPALINYIFTHGNIQSANFCPSAFSYYLTASSKLTDIPSHAECVLITGRYEWKEPELYFPFLPNLQELQIGQSCFQSVTRMVIKDMPRLEKIVVGDHSFTESSLLSIMQLRQSGQIIPVKPEDENEGEGEDRNENEGEGEDRNENEGEDEGKNENEGGNGEKDIMEEEEEENDDDGDSNDSETSNKTVIKSIPEEIFSFEVINCPNCTTLFFGNYACSGFHKLVLNNVNAIQYLHFNEGSFNKMVSFYMRSMFYSFYRSILFIQNT